MPRRLLGILIVLGLTACGGPEAAPTAPTAGAVETPYARAQQAEAARTGFPVEVTNAWGMRFRLIPGAEFPMGGAAPGEPALEDTAEHHVRFITPYYLQVGPVTNAQFRRFRPDHASGTAEHEPSLDGDGMPVRGVSYEDAVAFATWLRDQDSTWRYRLPTEAEWEYAARGRVESAASGPTNGWGIEGLGPDLAEWCHDRFGPYPTWPQDNPQGATFGEARVVRGGSRPETASRPICGRTCLPPDAHAPDLGFRLAFGLGYARHGYGAHPVLFRTVDPTAEGTEGYLRPDYEMFMISIPDRLTDRQNDPSARPFWTTVPHRAPTTVNLWPGRYYVYCHRTKDGQWARGQEVKFEIPGNDVIDVPIPRQDQASPQ